MSIKAPNKGDNEKKVGIHNSGITGIWYLFQAEVSVTGSVLVLNKQCNQIPSCGRDRIGSKN